MPEANGAFGAETLAIGEFCKFFLQNKLTHFRHKYVGERLKACAIW